MGQRLLVFPMDLAGHYLRCIELCRRLEDSYEIRFADSVKYGKYAKKAGYGTFEVKGLEAESGASSTSRLDFSWINRPVLQSILESQIKAIEEYRPDTVLGDASFTLKMAAEKTQTEYASLLNGYMTKYYRFIRMPPHNHPGYKYSGKMPSKIFGKIAHEVEYRTFKKIHRPFNQIRREYRLPSREYFLDEFEGDINLICDLPELFPQKKLPANYSFTGPLYYIGDDSEDEIRRFLDSHRPSILVSMGSTGSRENTSFLKCPAFKKYGIVSSSGEDQNLGQTNIYHKLFINNTAIMDRVDAVICHGGNGTVYQALTYGVPVLCITENLEQEWNVQRIREMGLGDFVENLNPETLSEQVDYWIERRKDPVFTEIKEEIETFMKKPLKLKP